MEMNMPNWNVVCMTLNKSDIVEKKSKSEKKEENKNGLKAKVNPQEIRSVETQRNIYA